MNQLYTVTLTDLGEYEIDVVACTAVEAESIGKVVVSSAIQSVADVRQIQREINATAGVAHVQPDRRYVVSATYSMPLIVEVPAQSAEEARRQARRIYENDPNPWDYDTGERDDVQWQTVREVRS